MLVVSRCRDGSQARARLRRAARTHRRARCLRDRGPATTAFDIVSRCFAPRVGIDEDPVTGSMHCVLSAVLVRAARQDRAARASRRRRGGDSAGSPGRRPHAAGRVGDHGAHRRTRGLSRVAEIIVHAGMAKTGSTSIQRWLTQNRRAPRGTPVQLVAADGSRPTKTRANSISSSPTPRVTRTRAASSWRGAPTDSRPRSRSASCTISANWRRRTARCWLPPKRSACSSTGSTNHFWPRSTRSAREHTVRVAYYVRPQHTAIEALWRQGGFRRAAPPSAAVVGEAASSLHYLRTKSRRAKRSRRTCTSTYARSAPISSTAAAQSPTSPARFLGIDTGGPDIQENSALPLELVNRLRHAPEGMFWNGTAELYPRGKLRAAAAQLELPSSPATKRSRQILRAYCRQEFEADNRAAHSPTRVADHRVRSRRPRSRRVVALGARRSLDPEGLAGRR